MHKVINFKIKGMNMDSSESTMNPEYAYENKNIRITADGVNNLFSISNIRGPKEAKVHIKHGDIYVIDEYFIKGTPIGQVSDNVDMVIFSAKNEYEVDINIKDITIDDIESENNEELNVYINSELEDYIYRLWFEEDLFRGEVLYKGDLNFNYKYPIEALIDTETDSIKKVYWTDNYNQPRMINIKADDKTKLLWDNYSFDFSVRLRGNEQLNIKKYNNTNGIFPAGVIQYFFTYSNEYMQESAIFKSSSLHYLSFEDRGAKKDETVNNSFEINLSGLDPHFEYVHIYSIIRSSINGVPAAKQLDRVRIYNNSISYTDNGTTGYSIDPTELLYKGCEDIKVNTLNVKDGTLFLGNITLNTPNITQDIKDFFKNTNVFFTEDSNKSIPLGEVNSPYSYNCSLEKSSKEITTFKYLETYRFGVQFRTFNGKWSEPVWIGDFKNNKAIDGIYWNTSNIQLTCAKAIINNSDLFKNLIELGYDSIRPVIVYPIESERECVYQGILCPTVFNVADRYNKNAYAQSSWFSRPMPPYSETYSKYAGYLKRADTQIEKYYYELDTTKNRFLNKGIKDSAICVLNNNNINTWIDINKKLNPSIENIYNNSPKAVDYFINLTKYGRISEYRHFKPIPGNLDFNSEIQCITNPPDSPYINYNINSSNNTNSITFDYIVSEYKQLCVDTYNNLHSIIGTDNFTREEFYQYWTLMGYPYMGSYEEGEEPPIIYYDSNLDNDEIGEWLCHNTWGNSGNSYLIVGIMSFFNRYFVHRLVPGALINNPNKREEHDRIIFNSLSYNNEVQYNDYKKTIPENIKYLQNLVVGQTALNRLRFPKLDSFFNKVMELLNFDDRELPSSTNLYTEWWQKHSEDFYVDKSIVTLHSPDIEFNKTNVTKDLKLRIIGFVPVNSNKADIDIQTSTPTNNSVLHVIKRYRNTKDPVLGEKHYIDPRMGDGKLPFNINVINSAHSYKSFLSYPIWIDYPYKSNPEESKFYTKCRVSTRFSEEADDVVNDDNKHEEFKILAQSDYIMGFTVYPFQSDGSLNNQLSSNDTSSKLDKKKLYNFKYSYNTYYFDNNKDLIWEAYEKNNSNKTGISKVSIFNNSDFSYLMVDAPKNSGESNFIYYGNVDKIVSPSYSNKIKDGYPIAVTGYNWSEYGNQTELLMQSTQYDYAQTVYDYKYQYDELGAVASTVAMFNPLLILQIWAIGNIIIAANKDYIDQNITLLEDNTKYILNNKRYTKLDEIKLVTPLSVQKNLQPILNISTTPPAMKDIYFSTELDDLYKKSPVSMKYKSSPHAVFALNYSDDKKIRTIPTLGINDMNIGNHTLRNWNHNDFFNKEEYEYDLLTRNQLTDLNNKTFYLENSISPNSEERLFWENDDNKSNGVIIDNIIPNINWSSSDYGIFPVKGTEYGGYWLGELYSDDTTNKFGGVTENALRNNQWLPCGEAIKLIDSNNKIKSSITLKWDEGDTYYQRYDHLKTYSELEYQNGINEIVSFMCETRFNIDGRCDKNRKKQDYFTVTPQNYNLINDVYSQQNNFFNYRILPESTKESDTFSYQITWSKTKTPSNNTDAWTNISLANILDLDTNLGAITSIQKINNNLVSFQDLGISQILFNEQTQIPSTNGVPIEIMNSGKIQGKRVISNTIGSTNKWGIINSKSGVYFVDTKTSDIFVIGGETPVNLTKIRGLSLWVHKNSNIINWNPINFNNIRTLYDPINEEILFITKNECLTFTEIEFINSFTSFYDYEKTPFMGLLNNKLVSLHTPYNSNLYKLWFNNEGDYNMFYNKYKPFYITIIANPQYTTDKIFNNIEYIADSWDNDDNYIYEKTFDKLTVWNEYQKGESLLKNEIYKPSDIKKKFRIWRINIPRSNSNKRDRIRNPWAYIKLSMEEENTNRTTLHNIMVHYFD